MNANKMLERLSHVAYLLNYLGVTPKPGSDIQKVIEEFSQELRIRATLRVQKDRPIDTVDYDLFCDLIKAVTSGTEADKAIVRTFLFGAQFRDGPLSKEHLLAIANTLMTHPQGTDTILRTWMDGIITGRLMSMGLTALDIATILTLLIDPDIEAASTIRVPMGRYHLTSLMNTWVNVTNDQRARASMTFGLHSDESSRIVPLHELDRLLNNPGGPVTYTITDQHLADIRVHELAPPNNLHMGWDSVPGFRPPHQQTFQQPRAARFQPPGYSNTTYNPVDQHEIDRQVHRVVCSVTEPSMGAKIIRPEVVRAIRELCITLHRAEIDLELTLAPPSK